MNNSKSNFTIKETLDWIREDNRAFGTSFIGIMFYSIKTFFKGPGWVVLLRLSQCRNPFVSFIAKILKTHYAHKYCIDIPACIKIGRRFSIGHGYGIVIHGNTTIGDDVCVSQFVNIGSTNGEFAVIGDNVYIGPMTCIVGGVKIGNNVTIGAGSVVVKDIPDNATAAGNPARVLNYDNPGMKIGVKKMN